MNAPCKYYTMRRGLGILSPSKGKAKVPCCRKVIFTSKNPYKNPLRNSVFSPNWSALTSTFPAIIASSKFFSVSFIRCSPLSWVAPAIGRDSHPYLILAILFAGLNQCRQIIFGSRIRDRVPAAENESTSRLGRRHGVAHRRSTSSRLPFSITAAASMLPFRTTRLPTAALAAARSTGESISRTAAPVSPCLPGSACCFGKCAE